MEFTIEQRASIRRGIMAGRRDMKKRGSSALVFANAFVKARGVEVPGLQVDDGTKNRIGSYILLHVSNGSSISLKYPEPEWFFDCVAREVNRAHSEAYWFSGMEHPDVVGYRMLIQDNVADMEKCAKIVACDNYGMGSGVFPKHEIVVLPPCCDGTSFLAVFSDEID